MISVIKIILLLISYGELNLASASHGRLPVSDGEIFGSTLAGLFQFPYQASIHIRDEHACSGAIINERWILTAAHCTNEVRPRSILILVRTRNLLYSGDIYYVERVIQHPDFDVKSKFVMIHDISLIKLDEELSLDNRVAPLPISQEAISGGVNARLSGWGITAPPGRVPDWLSFLDVKIIDNEECQVLYPDVEIRDTVLCTYVFRAEEGCVGDSGSPLVVEGKLVGILSWGKFCSYANPDVFTRVAEYVPWIIQNMN